MIHAVEKYSKTCRMELCMYVKSYEQAWVRLIAYFDINRRIVSSKIVPIKSCFEMCAIQRKLSDINIHLAHAYRNRLTAVQKIGFNWPTAISRGVFGGGSRIEL